jgi:Protein of unknown function (DUF4031)
VTVYLDAVWHTDNSGPRKGRQWCHLTADTKAELHEFAASIGLRREWFQDDNPEPTRMKFPGAWHYDVSATYRRRAVTAGAVEATAQGFFAVITAPGREGRERFAAPAEATR